MEAPRIEVKADGSISVSGELNHQTVPALLKQSGELLFRGDGNPGGDIAVDLNAVSRADSAGVALLIEWLRQAKRNNKTIRFSNMPEQMHEIATVSGVDKLLAP